MSEPQYSAEEAVARFFPRSLDYDHATARRLIDWLARCGYSLVKTDTLAARTPAPAPKRVREEERVLEEAI
jgi:hypothetical protein